MPYYRGYYRRGYGGYGRRYRRWYGRRGWTRSWRGGMNRRIQSGTRTFSCTVPVEGIYSAIVGAGSFQSNVYALAPWRYDPSNAAADYFQASLMMSDLYRTYAKLYDEVKLDWVSYEVTVLDVIGQGGVFSACRVWTTVDRKFTVEDSSYPMTAYQVRTSSGAQGTMLTNNSRTIIRRYIAARDLQERTVWHDATISEGQTGDPPALVIYDKAWNGVHNNCLFFSPALWYFLELNSAPAAQTLVNLSIKVKYGVTFRNAKFGLSAQANSKIGEIASRGPEIEVLPDVKEEEMGDELEDITQKVEDLSLEKKEGKDDGKT